MTIFKGVRKAFSSLAIQNLSENEQSRKILETYKIDNSLGGESPEAGGHLAPLINLIIIVIFKGQISCEEGVKSKRKENLYKTARNTSYLY